MEASSLEEKCRLATHQLKHFQQHVQQLETRYFIIARSTLKIRFVHTLFYRNKQLRAHLASEESDYSYCHGPSSKESTPSSKQEVI